MKKTRIKKRPQEKCTEEPPNSVPSPSHAADVNGEGHEAWGV